MSAWLSAVQWTECNNMSNIERRNGHKSIGLAAGLSIIPGVGTMYAGSVGSGAMMLGAFGMFILLSSFGLGIPLLIWLLLYALGLGSALGSAGRRNHRKTSY